MAGLPKYLHPNEVISKHGPHLPHWQQHGSTFFLTFRLADSIPQKLSEKYGASIFDRLSQSDILVGHDQIGGQECPRHPAFRMNALPV